MKKNVNSPKQITLVKEIEDPKIIETGKTVKKKTE